MIIDVNQHWMPDVFKDKSILDAWIRCFPRAYDEYGYLGTIPGTDKQQIILEHPKGYESLNWGPNIVEQNPNNRLEPMNAGKVDKAILRVPCWPEWLTLELSKQVNDALAKYVRLHPDRFLALAVVPPWGDKECLYEVERCIKELGCCGVQIQAHYGALYLDAEEFKPYFKKLNQLGVPICVHHSGLPVEYGDFIMKNDTLRRFYGRCAGQMIAVCRELFSGLFDEFPNLKLIHTMMGGGFFAYANLLLPQKSTVKEEMERWNISSTEKVKGYLERNLYIDITHPPTWGKAQLECAVKVHGADHLLFGSSYPLRNEWLLKGVEYIQSLDIGDKEKALILGGNAARLFNIKE